MTETPISRRVALGLLKAAIANLEPRQGQAVACLHLEGLTVSATARKMGISRQAVMGLEQRAWPNLMAELACLTNRNQAGD